MSYQNPQANPRLRWNSSKTTISKHLRHAFRTFSMSMEQSERILIKYFREASHGSAQIHSKLAEHFRDKTLSDPHVSYWTRQFRIGLENVDDLRCSGRPTDFQTHFRIERAHKALLNASVRDIAKTTDIAPSTVKLCLYSSSSSRIS
jgi:hypothetical protein